MQTIKPEFNGQAWWLFDHENASESDTAADQGGLLTLERHDNEFQVLMNRIDWLLNTGLDEDRTQAYEIARRAWQDCDFGAQNEQKLQDRLEDMIAQIHDERRLGAVFAGKALGLSPSIVRPAPEAPAPVLVFRRAA